jgi:hypothetical protein
MGNECNKHPENFNGYSPREFVEKFVKTNYFFQKEVFNLLPSEYLKEAESDKKRGRMQLVSGLEELAGIFEFSVLNAITKVCKACKKYMKNPYE